MTGSLGLRLRHARPSGGQRDTVRPWQGQPAGAAWRGRPANDGHGGKARCPQDRRARGSTRFGVGVLAGGVGGRRTVGPGVGLGHRQRRARCRRELEPPALPPLAAHRAMPSVLPEARLSAPPPREWGRSAVGAVSGASPQAAGDGALGGHELRGERGGRAVPARGGTDQATLLCGLVPRTHGWIPLLGDALPFHTRPTAPQPQREEQEPRVAGTLNVCFLFPEEPPGSLQPARDGVSLAAIAGSRAGGGDGGPSFRPSKRLSFEISFARLSPRVPLGTCRGPRENRPLPATRSSPCPGSCDPLARGPRPRHL